MPPDQLDLDRSSRASFDAVPSSSSVPPPAPASPVPRSPVHELTAPSLARTASAQSTQSCSSTALNARIYGVALVGFDHALGPNVEFLHPPELAHNDDLKENLPFLALPDGAHARDEDYTYFHLYLPNLLEHTAGAVEGEDDTPPPDGSGIELHETVFGISCNRQIMAHELLNKGKEVTRSTVQKSIVVLASKPIFGPLRDKLGVITRSFFAQRDFQDKSILVDLFDSFQQLAQPADPNVKPSRIPLSPEHSSTSRFERQDEKSDQVRSEVEGAQKHRKDKIGKRRSFLGEKVVEAEEEEEGIYMGTFLRGLVHKFRFKTLMLLKLLMLQRRVLFYSTTTTVEQLCTFQYSLVALIPALLTSLQDAASPVLANRLETLQKPTSLKTSDKGSLIRYLGLPLEVFGQGSFFQPYLPLQQIEMLSASKSYLVGTTNSIIQQQRDCNIDVVVNLDTISLQIMNPALTPLITLTPADRKWMDELVTTVDQSWNDQDPMTPTGRGWIGSEDFLRGKFEEYVCSLLACVKFGDFLEKGHHSRPDMLLSAPELESYNPTSFNEGFIKAFKGTKAFEIWDKHTDEVMFDLVEPKHPMEGKTNPFEDVGIRLVSGLHDLHLPENLGPTKDAIQRGLATGSEGIWGAVKWARDEASKRQKELQIQLQQQEKEANAARVDQTGSEPVKSSAATGDFSQLATGGLDVAQKSAASVAAGLGGLWGKARNSTLFSSSPAIATLPSSSNIKSEATRPISVNDPIPRPSSPTPSIISTTSSTKSSSLVTVQAQSELTTPPIQSTSTFASFGRERGLKPLSTAVAAAPASPSTSASTSSGSTPGGGGGFSSFFGGIRRSFVDQANAASSTPSSSTSGSDSSGSGLSIPAAFGSLGGWGSTPRHRTASTPTNGFLSSSSSISNVSSTSPSSSDPPPAAQHHRLSSSPNPSTPFVPRPLTTGAKDQDLEHDDEDHEETIVVKDLDSETNEDIVVLRVRNLDKDFEREETRRKLEGT
ncbi:uncharacterized protein JCM15063_006334 [Sporobolomyces koalae]|uniref:uncharacterized protein n=1 Tax=Sporobolomyces koalae TaxID=500713 RepID=UPI00317A95A9